MPFVRFSRDKRGYEHLYLVDPGRDRGRSRILYWFRTPPGVKVGRSPFDSETQRALERQNPGVQFDWPQIVAAKIPPPVQVESWREKRRIERAIKRARAEEAASDELSSADMEEPLVEAVEVGEVAAVADGLMESSPEMFEEPSPKEDAVAAADTASGPRPAEGRRRRRRRRKAHPETAPVPGTGNGELDPPTPNSAPSNDE